jgi:Asp-tRNA(Asn)/Glu-tRNA(Gln) amidotransferase A subunit family amidase
MATGPVPASISETVPPQAPDDGKHHSPDMTAIFNLISPCPALTVPCGLDADGMPVGAQFIGRRWNELSVLRVGAALEDALPPIGRPPFHI